MWYKLKSGGQRMQRNPKMFLRKVRMRSVLDCDARYNTWAVAYNNSDSGGGLQHWATWLK